MYRTMNPQKSTNQAGSVCGSYFAEIFWELGLLIACAETAVLAPREEAEPLSLKTAAAAVEEEEQEVGPGIKAKGAGVGRGWGH